MSLVLLALLSSCGRPIPYTEEDTPSIAKIDTLFMANGEWLTGQGIYYTPENVVPTKIWPFWLGLFVLFLIFLISYFVLRRAYKQKLLRQEAEESQVVMSLLEDKVSLIQNLADTHEKTGKRSKGFLYFDQLEELQGIVNAYHAYLEDIRDKGYLLKHLEEALNKGKHNIMFRAKAQLKQSVSKEDYEVLACLFAGMTPATISFLFGLKQGTVRTKKSRLKDKIGLLADTKERDYLLSNL